MALQHPEAAKVVMFVSSDKEEPSHQRWLPGRINAAALEAQVGPMPDARLRHHNLNSLRGSLVAGQGVCMLHGHHLLCRHQA